MDEEETMGEDVGALSAMGGIDFAQLKSDPMGLIQSVYDRQLAAEAAREKTQRELFERGEENIRARNAGMSQSEKLFAISQALLAPRKYRGIAGTIGKLSGAFGDIAEADRKARLARETELERFRNSYLSGVADRGVTSARTAAELVRAGSAFARPVAGVEVNGELRDPYSNAPINPNFNNVFDSLEAERNAYAQLEGAPTEANLKALLDFYPRYAPKIRAAFQRGLAKLGKGN
jgi:hypothetical protein